MVQISFFIIIIIMIWGSYKTKLLLIPNYLIGLLLLFLFTYLHIEELLDPILIVTLMFTFNMIVFTILFVSSLFIYFDYDGSKRHYFVVPFISYLVLILLESISLKVDNPITSMFIPVFIAFFPLYILKYYRKYIKEQNG